MADKVLQKIYSQMNTGKYGNLQIGATQADSAIDCTEKQPQTDGIILENDTKCAGNLTVIVTVKSIFRSICNKIFSHIYVL